MGRG
jgi:hypothetical protein